MNHPVTAILEIRNLQAKRGGVTVLDIPTLDIRAGEVLSLIGPNGAGKSSLLLVLACLLPWRQGTLRFHETPVTAGNGVLAYRRKISMVFQEPLLFDATVHENVASGLKLRGLSRSNILSMVPECLERFGIVHLADRHARKLSGGEAQRTSLARAFAIKPEMIFLDEPFSSLDPPTRDGLIEDLQRILRETGTTAVMATHDRLEALRLSDRVAVMKDGRIAQIDVPETVMNHPADEFIASFVGMETILAGEIVRSGAGTVTASIGGRELEMVGEGKPGERILCCIRPEQVTLSTRPVSEGVSARNTFAGRIVQIVPLGLFYKISLDCGFTLVAYVTAPSMENLTLEAGKSIFASVKATAVHLIKK
jgi:tungstate transport system ATP-binding protein